jgi:rhodanese-related sulfurtransferase
MQHLTVLDLAEWLADASRPPPLLLDVREAWEFETCHIGGSQLMTMSSITTRLNELDENATIVCICHHGSRSLQVAQFLSNNDFNAVFNLSGGVHAWSLQVDNAMPVY